MNTQIPAAADAIRTRKSGVKIDRIVIHTMEGTFAGTCAWFKTPGRSVPTAAHYLIGREGSICQMVPDDKKALHAGSKTEANWNDRSIGIEHEGYAAKGGFEAAMLRASAKVVAILCKKFSIPIDRTHIVGHGEIPGVTHTDPGVHWPWDEYMKMVLEGV